MPQTKQYLDKPRPALNLRSSFDSTRLAVFHYDTTVKAEGKTLLKLEAGGGLNVLYSLLYARSARWVVHRWTALGHDVREGSSYLLKGRQENGLARQIHGDGIGLQPHLLVKSES